MSRVPVPIAGRERDAASARRPQRLAPSRQRGAALIVGLVLLVVLTVLAVSGVNMATMELNMAGNTQARELAFQAAETGIDRALSGPVSPAVPQTYTGVPIGDGSYEFDATIECVGWSRVPDRIFGEFGAARAIHYLASAEGRGPRDAVSRHSQGIYIIGPDPNTNANFNPAVSPGAC
jgi:hypothetical protein